jgi:hypothetical protein
MLSGQFGKHLTRLLKRTLCRAQIATPAPNYITTVCLKNRCRSVFGCDWVQNRMYFIRAS